MTSAKIIAFLTLTACILEIPTWSLAQQTSSYAAPYQGTTGAPNQPATSAPYQGTTGTPNQQTTSYGSPYQQATGAPNKPATSAPYQQATGAPNKPTTMSTPCETTPAPYKPSATPHQQTTAAPCKTTPVPYKPTTSSYKPTPSPYHPSSTPAHTPCATSKVPLPTPCASTPKYHPTPEPSLGCGSQALPPAGCTDVSVESDATYCISGPICSGSGDTPAGTRCPTKGAVAVKDCLSKLKSWDQHSSTCIAPQDTICRKIKTGAWGCVFNSDVATYTAQYEAAATGTNAGLSTSAIVGVVIGCMALTAGVAVAGTALYFKRRHCPESPIAASPSFREMISM